MKKILHLLLICFLLGLCSPAYAQTSSQNILSDNDEGIFLFDVDIQVQPNGNIQVKEYIALNAQWQKIRRGIYRDIPISITEQVTPISLSMDGQSHPFFTERQKNSLRVNFGNDNYIAKGIHAYSFVYTYTGAINFLKNYDELYWNVTGNGWAFPIEKARVRVSFPSYVNVQQDGISVYTGRTGEKNHDAKQIAPLAFETTKPLWPQEGLTIAIPFAKGAIQEPPLSKRLANALSPQLLFSLAMFTILIGFFAFTWFTMGKDPYYVNITQYEPPQGISPAFMYYLETQLIDSKLFTSLILDLVMKGYIEVTQTDGILSKTQLVRKREPALNDDLPFEEKKAMSILLSAPTLTLDKSAAKKFEELREALVSNSSTIHSFKQQAKRYIVSNKSCIAIAIILVLLLGTVPFILQGPDLIFVNLHFSIFFLGFTLPFHKILTKIIWACIFTLFYSGFWFGSGALSNPSLLLCQVIFLVSTWSLTFYATLIRNVTPEGKSLFELINGFKKYMKTAEVHRVAASNPVEMEKIFCAYLPFAFALGLHNKWIKKFSRVLDQATIERCTAAAGGIRSISSGLSSSISSATASSKSGGSHGGGCSGGGHGGGGGGGR